MTLKKHVVLTSTKLGQYNRTTVPNEVGEPLGFAWGVRSYKFLKGCN